MSGVSALDTEAPVGLAELLDRNSRAALIDGIQMLGLALAISDEHGKTIAGAMPAAAAPLVADWEPLVAAAGELRFGVVGIFNEGNVIGRIVVGPVQPAFDDQRVRGILKNVRRMVDAFIVDGLKRALSARMHMATLEEANRELTDKNRELAKMVDKLQEADRVKSNFLATVSHELRTPLTSVIGYSEMLLEGIAGALNDEQRDYVRTVMEKGDQLLQLITGILDISRMEAGEMKVRKTPFDLAEVVRIAVQTVAPNARRKRLQLEAIMPDAMSQAVGDRDKTRQVVINLIGNAVKFTPEGGTVKVIVERGGLARVDKPNGAIGLRIAIVDTGIGIPPEHFQRVFDPFYQVDNTSTREYGGTGLGLSIVKRFVEAQGGQVWLESEVGKGTSFRFTLPSEEST